MLGGRQRRMLSLAAREADIVSISLLDPGGPDYATRVDWVRHAAGPRFDELELHVNASLVAVNTTPAQQELERIAARTGQAPDQVVHSPGSLVGSVQQIIDALHARREQFGLSYYVVQARNIEAFAPVIAGLG